MQVKCKICETKFITYPSRIKIGSGKYCSKTCSDAVTLFNTGHIPALKGKKMTFKQKSSLNLQGLKLGQGWNRGLRIWEGTESKYNKLHYWLIQQIGKAERCSNCGTTDRVDWANKSQTYQKNISDWIELCRSCHGKYDWKYRKGMLNQL